MLYGYWAHKESVFGYKLAKVIWSWQADDINGSQGQQGESLFQLQCQRALRVRVPEVEAGERIELCVR